MIELTDDEIIDHLFSPTNLREKLSRGLDSQNLKVAIYYLF